MRLITYEAKDGSHGAHVGVMPPLVSPAGEDGFVPLPVQSMLQLIGEGNQGLLAARQRLETEARLPLANVRLLAPIPAPRRNVFCLGWNYVEHRREAAIARAKLRPKEEELPERPIFFTKATTAILAPDAPIPAHARDTTQLDWEVELAVIIGRGGIDIPRERALDHVFGYTVVNDVSARDVQTNHGGQFFKGKSLDGTCPIGPWIVTADEIPDPGGLRLRCRVNGETKQDSSTSNLIFDVPAIIAWLSKGMTLLAGDIIATGTPAGVGFARNPPEFLKPGDVVECEVEKIGLLRNSIAMQ